MFRPIGIVVTYLALTLGGLALAGCNATQRAVVKAFAAPAARAAVCCGECVAKEWRTAAAATPPAPVDGGAP